MPASTETSAAVAAHDRTSVWPTTTTRSAVSRAIWTASVNRRGTSHTTVAPPRRPASTTASVAAASGSCPRRVPDNRVIPRCRGSASRTADHVNRPPWTARSGQRTPAMPSPPTSRSIPPPHGSRSTSRGSVAACANAAANNEAPAPPRPPITATTSPRVRSSRAESAASASARTSSRSCVGSVRTCWAPTATAAAQIAGSGSELSSTVT
jgi:hypothetical protein